MWEGYVLVAELIADDDSGPQIKEIEMRLQVLAMEFETKFGLKTQSSFRPHVILGYFGNETLAELAVPRLDTWTRQIAEKIGESETKFGQIGLHYHTDAATWRKATIT